MGLGPGEHSESLMPVKETPAQQHIVVSPPHVLLVHTTHSDGHTLDTGCRTGVTWPPHQAPCSQSPPWNF